MDTVDRRVLRVLLESERPRFHNAEEKRAIQAMALYIDRPVSDVYEMPDGSLTGRITNSGRARLARQE